MTIKIYKNAYTIYYTISKSLEYFIQFILLKNSKLKFILNFFKNFKSINLHLKNNFFFTFLHFEI